MNTDRELWREVAGDYYSPSIHVTASGGIGINICGRVYVRTLRDWYSLVDQLATAEARERQRLEKQILSQTAHRRDIMGYDEKCHKLAKDFLEDEHDLNLDKLNAHLLAQAIQDAIEDWVVDRRERANKAQLKESHNSHA